MVRFNEKEIRIMGRSASGVRGINMPYDVPENPELVIKNDTELTPEQVTDVIIKYFSI